MSKEKRFKKDVFYVIKKQDIENTKNHRGGTLMTSAVSGKKTIGEPKNDFVFAESIRERRKARERDKFGKTKLHYAVITTNAERVRQLIEQGADVNAVDSYGNTPLHYVGKTMEPDPENKNPERIIPEIEIARILIENGANINAKNAKGFTPPHCAILMNNLELVRLFLKNGAILDEEDLICKGKYINSGNVEEEIIAILNDAKI